MKTKNGIFALGLAGLFSAHIAQAVVFPDQIAKSVENSVSDDENRDAVSHFGSSDSIRKRNQAEIAKPLSPISDGSFSSDVARTPASAPAASRGPASDDSAPPAHAFMNKATRAKSYQEVAVIATELGFFPSTLFLTQGIPVKLFITGASAKSQCFMLDTFGVRRQIRNQKVEEVNFTPDQTGTFAFSCPMNGAKGTVVVKEIDLGASERAPASVSVSETTEVAPPHTEKKSDINDDDFSAEFRNP